MAKRLNWRLVKIHRTYSYDQAAKLLGVHKNAVRNWVKDFGLAALTEKRPYLIRGSDLKNFLRDRQAKRNQPLGLKEMFCFSCHRPRAPGPDLVEDVSGPTGAGLLRGICPVCMGLMNLRIARDRIPDFLAPAESAPTGGADTKGGRITPLKQSHHEEA